MNVILDVENQKAIIKELRMVLNTAYSKEHVDEGFILVVMQAIDKYLTTLSDKELIKEFISWAASPLSKMIGAENSELVKYGTKYINYSAYDGTSCFYIFNNYIGGPLLQQKSYLINMNFNQNVCLMNGWFSERGNQVNSRTVWMLVGS